MVAKRFFHLCAGLFLLALTFHLGTQSATAIGLPVQGAHFQSGNAVQTLSFSTGRVVYGFGTDQFGSVFTALAAPSQSVPGVEDIVATLAEPAGDGANYFVLLANSDVYTAELGASTWTYGGNLLGGTANVRDTWGGLKARYSR